MAFTVPLDYEAYCQVEDCLADPENRPPHPELLRAIDHCGVADPKVKTIVYWHLQAIDGRKLDGLQLA